MSLSGQWQAGYLNEGLAIVSVHAALAGDGEGGRGGEEGGQIGRKG
jgi:hypothetical protein